MKKSEKCFFCERDAVYRNSLGLNLCKKHRNDRQILCRCGEKPEKKESVLYCNSCGSIRSIDVAFADSHEVKFNRITHNKIKQARSLLNNVPEEKVFYACDGTVLKNLQETMDYLKDIDESTFRYHVNQDKNDFCTWIKEVIGDNKLAARLKKHTERISYYKTLRNRVIKLKRTAL